MITHQNLSWIKTLLQLQKVWQWVRGRRGGGGAVYLVKHFFSIHSYRLKNNKGLTHKACRYFLNIVTCFNWQKLNSPLRSRGESLIVTPWHPFCLWFPFVYRSYRYTFKNSLTNENTVVLWRRKCFLALYQLHRSFSNISAHQDFQMPRFFMPELLIKELWLKIS